VERTRPGQDGRPAPQRIAPSDLRSQKPRTQLDRNAHSRPDTPFTRCDRLHNRSHRVYTNIQPVVQPTGCLFTRYRRLSNRLFNQFDNRLLSCKRGIVATQTLSNNSTYAFDLKCGVKCKKHFLVVGNLPKN